MKKQGGICIGILLFVISPGIIGQNPASGKGAPQVPGAPAESSTITHTDFGRVPLYFIPNQGQMDGRVAFYIRGRDKDIYFAPGGVTFSLSERGIAAVRGREAATEKGLSLRKESPSPRWVAKLDFLGANKDVKPVGEEIAQGIVSYFKGTPKGWQAALPTYSRIVYRDLWPGIDLAYSGTTNRLKYEFIVHPGADPTWIRLAYRGVEGLFVDGQGRLEVKTPAGGFKDDTPVAWQQIAGARKNISLSYDLEPRSQDNGRAPATKEGEAPVHVYGFKVGAYDPSQPLVLDPSVVVFGGFIGGGNTEEGRGVAVDALGNVYVTGYTSSTETSFPETVGPDLTFNGSFDAFVAKVDASGAALVYCGYIGGTDDDRGNGIAVDSSGNAYVTGYTLSTQTSFPVVAGYDMTHNGLKDAFVAKVNAVGDGLSYCTYIGGSADDFGTGIAVDGSGNAYISGYTGSSEATFPEITGPDLSFNGGTYDAFVCKLNSSGTGRYYCGYIGGSGDDYGNGIAVDGSGNAYVAGNTSSTQTTFPVVVGPDLTVVEATNGFVAKVNSSGASLSYCGFVGGDQSDQVYAVAVDSKGSAYVTGYTDGGLPVLVGPDLTFNGWHDAFVAKVTPNGDGYVYFGYIGGSGIERGYGIAVDSSGNAYVTGETDAYGSVPFPLIDAFDTTEAGNIEGFIVKVRSSGSKLTYSSYIGGGSWDIGYGATADGRGNVYLAGYTIHGTDFPIAVGPDLTHNGGSDAFVAKIYHYWAPGPKTTAAGDFDGDGSAELAVDFGTSGAWMWNSGAWTQLSTMNPEGMISANVDGNADDELFMEFGYAGLWLWDGGGMTLLSEEDVETMAAGDVDADGSDELVVDFGSIGLWLWNGGAWNQLSGANLERMVVANLDGSGGAEISGDFGAVGLWIWSGGSWTQLSGVNVENMIPANTDGAGGEDLIGDFGPVGLWLYSNSAWEQWSGVNADYMIAADIDGNSDDEAFGDFSGTGLWLWDGGVWTIFSGLDVEYMLAADTDGDGSDEMLADFDILGIWHWDGGTWNQISGVDPENMIAGDIDGDGADEVFVDFGDLGLWLWNGGVWSQVSAANPD